MLQQKAALFVLIILVLGFFVVSMVMISRNGELTAAVEKLGARVDYLETQVRQMTQAMLKQEAGR